MGSNREKIRDLYAGNQNIMNTMVHSIFVRLSFGLGFITLFSGPSAKATENLDIVIHKQPAYKGFFDAVQPIYIQRDCITETIDPAKLSVKGKENIDPDGSVQYKKKNVFKKSDVLEKYELDS